MASASSPVSAPTPPGRAMRVGRRRVAKVALFAIVVVAAGLLWKANEQRRERNAALADATAGDFARAEPILEQLLLRTPDDAEVVEALARGYAKTDDPRAEIFLSRWVALRPGQIQPLRSRWDFLRKRKEWEKAFLDGKALVDLQPNDWELLRTVTGQAFSAGRFAEAEKLCQRILAHEPGDTGIQLLLSEVLRAVGDWKGAAVVLDRILKEQPALTSALFSRALLYDEAAEPEKAVPLLREVIRLDRSRQRTAGYELSLVLERLGRTEEARKVMADVRRRQDAEVFAEAIKTQPDNLDLRVQLAVQLLTDNHTEDGIGLLQATLSRDPTFRPAHRALAAYYDKQGDSNLATQHRRLAGDP